MNTPSGNPSASPETSALIGGIVLAAGRSSRMGRDKATLQLGGSTFVQRAVNALRDGGCHAVVVVTPPDFTPDVRGGILAVVNPQPDSEQIVSIRIGLRSLPAEARAALVLPVDAPAVLPETVRRLIETFSATGAPIVRPLHAGQPGHPTLFARPVFNELSEPHLERGAETVVERHAADRVDVTVDDPGVTSNVNTPEDYTRLQRDG